MSMLMFMQHAAAAAIRPPLGGLTNVENGGNASPTDRGDLLTLGQNVYRHYNDHRRVNVNTYPFSTEISIVIMITSVVFGIAFAISQRASNPDQDIIMGIIAEHLDRHIAPWENDVQESYTMLQGMTAHLGQFLGTMEGHNSLRAIDAWTRNVRVSIIKYIVEFHHNGINSTAPYPRGLSPDPWIPRPLPLLMDLMADLHDGNENDGTANGNDTANGANGPQHGING